MTCRRYPVCQRATRIWTVALLLAAMTLSIASMTVVADELPTGHVTPPYGLATGGTNVTITGSGFTGATGVTFGGLATASFTVASDTEIDAATPAHDIGATAVVVTEADSTTATVGGFFFIPASTVADPTVTAVNPMTGSTAGHTPVVITGTGFRSDAHVTFGGVPATDVHVLAAAIITAQTPAQAVGAVDVTVMNGNGHTGTLTGGYTYAIPPPADPPTITRIDPNTGPASSLSPTSTTMDDNRGLIVAIIGTGFQRNAAITFGGVPVEHSTFVSGSTLLAAPPAHAAGKVPVTVTNPDNQSFTLPDAFTYLAPTPGAPPTIASIDPNTGPATVTTTASDSGGPSRTIVTITGTGFQPGASVKFDGIAAHDVGVLSDGTLITLAPPHAAGAVDVVVTNRDGQSATASGGFTYVAPATGAAPTVTKVDPNTAVAGGNTGGEGEGIRLVAITGTNFVHGATVKFGDVTADHAEVIGPTAIIVSAPNHAPGVVDITVTNPDGKAGTLSQAFTFIAPLTVAAISPNTGPATGGTDVTITGTNFLPGATVRFDGVAATNIVVSGDGTTVTAKTPAHPSGVANLYVLNGNGQRGGLSHAFTFTGDSPPPTNVALAISDVDPHAGFATGGMRVAVRGAGFRDGVTVTFDTMPGADVHVVNSTLLYVTTPGHAVGAVDVTVSDGNGRTNTLTGGYSYIAPPTHRPADGAGVVNGPPPVPIPSGGRGTAGTSPGTASVAGGATSSPLPTPPQR
jgi:hypothetical protein